MKNTKTSPCANCPYRKDAPAGHWSVEEFRDLLRNDADQMGVVYGCHKNDGHICRGFLMDQVKRGFPSIAVRLWLSRNGVRREYLDNLISPSDMFESVAEMAETNFPELER